MRIRVPLGRRTQRSRTFLPASITYVTGGQRFLGLVTERFPAPRVVATCPGFEVDARGSNGKEKRIGDPLDNRGCYGTRSPLLRETQTVTSSPEFPPSWRTEPETSQPSQRLHRPSPPKISRPWEQNKKVGYEILAPKILKERTRTGF